MHHRLLKYVWLFIAISLVLIATAPVGHTKAAQVASVARCTDNSALGGNDTAYVNFSYQLSLGRTIHLQFPGDPSDQWKMLVRHDATGNPLPFAVFYTETGDHRVVDNADIDTDSVPDFAERVYNCLVEAHSRYSPYYDLDQTQQNVIAWMPLDYVDGATQRTGSFHPVYLQIEERVGLNQPFFLRDFNQTDYVGLNKTYTNIDSTNKHLIQNDPRSPYPYPYLENTVYHEVFHAYQGLYKKPDLFDAADWWTYEGTAVFATDQALLLPCTDLPSLNNPPRIPNRAFPPTKNPCDPPYFHERISESQLSSLSTKCSCIL